MTRVVPSHLAAERIQWRLKPWLHRRQAGAETRNLHHSQYTLVARLWSESAALALANLGRTVVPTDSPLPAHCHNGHYEMADAVSAVPLGRWSPAPPGRPGLESMFARCATACCWQHRGHPRIVGRSGLAGLILVGLNLLWREVSRPPWPGCVATAVVLVRQRSDKGDACRCAGPVARRLRCPGRPAHKTHSSLLAASWVRLSVLHDRLCQQAIRVWHAVEGRRDDGGTGRP